MLQPDRLLHTYIIGKTGVGKSTLLESMILQDIRAYRGCTILDPHGDMIQKVMAQIPSFRSDDVINFDFSDPKCDLQYNPFKNVSAHFKSLVASGILEVFAKLWGSAWGVKLEHILRHVILTLLDQPNANLSHIPDILLSSAYRKEALKHVTTEAVALFWKREFPGYTKYDLLPVLNKVGGMLAHPVIKRTLCTNPNRVSLRKAMDEKKILLVNLSKGHIGADAAHILGALFMTSLSSAAFSRASITEDDRVPHMLYADEFQNFTTLSLVNMFSEMRKFKLGMVLAHQYLHQLDHDIRHAVLGNIGTLISFRVGVEDAHVFAKEYYPYFDFEDVITLPNHEMYLKLLIDGVPSRPFRARTILPKFDT